MSPSILVINPGSTSTKVALYQGSQVAADVTIACSPEELQRCTIIADQVPFRTKQVQSFLAGQGIDPGSLDAIVARGGPLQPVSGGVYAVNPAMLSDALSDGFVMHVSRIACVIAADIAKPHNLPVFVVDPVSTDELAPISRVSGLKEVPRKSLTHALNMKAVAREYSKQQSRSYKDMNLITAHLGGGTSLAIHSGGRMIDTVDGNGEGPFSPERSGGLRVDDLLTYMENNRLSAKDALSALTRAGGLISHLGTANATEVEERINAGDAYARHVYEALAYAVSKHICALSAAVSGDVDAILITGGLAHSVILTGWIRERVEFLAPVEVFPGEREMDALALGALRVLNGTEPILTYPGT